MAIQQSDGPKSIGFFGTRNMGVTHQKLVEVLSYAYASTVSCKFVACLRRPSMYAFGRAGTHVAGPVA
eukprot:363424-Chlamydomonas_euryale.AAC.7